jgi:hypothetical protein
VPTYNKYERVQMIMAYLNMPESKRTKQTLASICKGTGISVNSIKATIYTDYPYVFDRAETTHRGIILSGEWPGYEPFDLQSMTDALVKANKPAEVKDERWDAQYFDRGIDAFFLNLRTDTLEALRKAVRDKESPSKDWDKKLQELYNLGGAIQVLVAACRSRDRETTFNRRLKGTSKYTPGFIRKEMS